MYKVCVYTRCIEVYQSWEWTYTAKILSPRQENTSAITSGGGTHLQITALLVAPDAAKHCKNWHSNDGDGLSASDAKVLAKQLQIEIASGRCKGYELEYTAALDAMPDEPCKYCNGTGIRTGERLGMIEKKTCNGCSGKGKVRPNNTHYPFSEDNVKEFAAFLEDCGGFEIC